MQGEKGNISAIRAPGCAFLICRRSCCVVSCAAYAGNMQTLPPADSPEQTRTFGLRLHRCGSCTPISAHAQHGVCISIHQSIDGGHCVSGVGSGCMCLVYARLIPENTDWSSDET